MNANQITHLDYLKHLVNTIDGFKIISEQDAFYWIFKDKKGVRFSLEWSNLREEYIIFAVYSTNPQQELFQIKVYDINDIQFLFYEDFKIIKQYEQHTNTSTRTNQTNI